MKATTPVTLQRRRWSCLSFTELLSAGNLEAAAACFARDACLLTQDATAIHDREHIRPLLAQLIARRTRIEVELSSVLVAGDVALAREHWTIHIDGPKASRFEQSCSPHPHPEADRRPLEAGARRPLGLRSAATLL